MCEDSETLCVCAFGGILTTISKKWALLIINKLGTSGRMRFSTLMSELQDVSPRTLSDTLRELQEEHLVGRESFSEIPPRVEYFLTEEGIGLRESIIPLMRWASDRDSQDAGQCEKRCRRRKCFPDGKPCTKIKGTD